MRTFNNPINFRTVRLESSEGERVKCNWLQSEPPDSDSKGNNCRRRCNTQTSSRMLRGASKNPALQLAVHLPDILPYSAARRIVRWRRVAAARSGRLPVGLRPFPGRLQRLPACYLHFSDRYRWICSILTSLLIMLLLRTIFRQILQAAEFFTFTKLLYTPSAGRSLACERFW